MGGTAVKKVLISALVAAMCLGFASVASAATLGVIQPVAFSDIAGHEAQGELTLLGAMGVFTGESGLGGAVKPDDPLTRAQFCKVVVTAMGRGSTAAGLMGLQPTFTDGASIPTWAWGYVNVAVYMGIINGYPDGSFRPNNPVTYAEAVTMLIKAVSGHKEMVGPGVWPYNFLFYGIDNGFTGDVDVGFANLPCTRGDMARMLVATMRINKLNAKGEEQVGSAVLYEGYEADDNGTTDTTTDDHYNHLGNVYTGTFAGYTTGASIEVTNSHDSAPDANLQPWTIGLGEKVWIVGAASYDGLKNLPVFVVKKADGGYFIWVTGESNTVSGVFKEFAKSNTTLASDDLVVLKDGTKVPFDPSAGFAVTLNQAGGHVRTDLVENDEVVLTLNDNGLIANAIAMRVTDTGYIANDITKSVKTPSEVDTKIDVQENDGALEHDDLAIPKTATVLVNGAAADRDTLAKFDFVQIYRLGADPSGAVVELRAVRNAVEGTVAASTTSYPGPVYKLTIGDKTYTWNPQCLGTVLPGKDTHVKYGLDVTGKLFVPIGFETLNPYVLLLGWTDVPTATGDTITVDNGGQEVTYSSDGDDYSGYAFGQQFGTITLDTGTGQVTDFAPLNLAGAVWYDILAVDPANKTLTAKNLASGATEFNSDIVVYKWDAAAGRYVFVPLANVSATWDVRRLGASKLFVYHPADVSFTFTLPTSPVAGTEYEYLITTKINDSAAIPGDDYVRYKAILTKDGSPVAGLVIKYPEATDTNWPTTYHTMTTDADGVVWFGPAGGFQVSSIPALKTTGVTTPFRTTLGVGTYTLTVYMVDLTNGNSYLLDGGSVTFTIG